MTGVPALPTLIGSTINTANAAMNTAPAFLPDAVTLHRRMRFNPLRLVTPENLALAHDNFDIGYLWQAALFWDAMIRRDDTLSFVVPQLENAIAARPWGVFKKKGADDTEAARHAAALEYFYANCTAVNAFDRNERGDRHMLLKQMGSSYAMRYAMHHFVWRREPAKMIEVEGAAPVPALTAELEFVPLWFFENTTGTLRLVRWGYGGGLGEELDFGGEWMVTHGQGLMFAAAGCYIFKRLTFQDWTNFNERYSNPKVVGMTNSRKDSEAGRNMATMVNDFNGDQGIVLYECPQFDKPPISLLGPEGTVSVDIYERFLERQDRKMAVMFRGSDLRNMSREKDNTGVSAQIKETEALELAHCAAIASAARTFIDRKVIEYCFGRGVEPLAYFGLPEMNDEDAQQLRENAGFIADRGGKPDLVNIADRLGVPLATDEAEDEEVLQPLRNGAAPGEPDPAESARTANARRVSRLEELVEEALRTANGGPGSGRYPKGSGGGRLRDAFGRKIDETQGGLSVRENISRGSKAAAYALRKQTDVRDAMYRKEVGRIDFIWGAPGEKAKDWAGGSGLAHIAAKHGEADVRRLPVVLAKGKITPHPEGAEKRLVSYGNYTAALVKEKSRSAWVLTGFSKGRQVNR